MLHLIQHPLSLLLVRPTGRRVVTSALKDFLISTSRLFRMTTYFDVDSHAVAVALGHAQGRGRSLSFSLKGVSLRALTLTLFRSLSLGVCLFHF